MNVVEQFSAAMPDIFEDASKQHAVGRSDETIPEGRRNAHLASLAGSMRHRDMTPEAMSAALLEENARRCDPPLSEKEVRAIAVSVGRYVPEALTTTAFPIFDDVGMLNRPKPTFVIEG